MVTFTTSRTAAKAIIENTCPNWINLVTSGKFRAWHEKQQDEIKKLAKSSDPEDAILLINLYNRDINSSKCLH